MTVRSLNLGKLVERRGSGDMSFRQGSAARGEGIRHMVGFWIGKLLLKVDLIELIDEEKRFG